MFHRPQQVAQYGKAVGREFKYVPVPFEALQAKVPPYMWELMTYIRDKGKDAVPFSDITKRISGQHTTFAQWLASTYPAK